MGILIISITAGIVFLALMLILYFRRKETRDKPGGPGGADVLEKETGKDEGIYD